ncbi:MAG: hypothetical protein IBJ15_20685, partial [Alphaproteobacteria bacterium]|nr:hypothetical protein [Alphaproteobacteria bacterium]
MTQPQTSGSAAAATFRLRQVAERHWAYIFGKSGGQRADSRKQNFAFATLSGGNLSSAILSSSNFSNCTLT